MAQAVAMGLLCVTLVIAATCDLRTHKVPNVVIYPAILAGFGWWLVVGLLGLSADQGVLAPLADSVIGFGAGFIPFAILFAMGGLGGGDVKTMGAVGAISAQWQCVLSTTVYAFVIGALMAVFVMIRKRLVKRTLGRLFGAALMAAARTRPDLPQDTERIPFAVAICIGGIVAGMETLLDVKTPWAGF